VTGPAEAERLARAALCCLAEPGDEVMGALLRTCSPAEIVTAVTEGQAPAGSAASGGWEGRTGTLFAPAVSGDEDGGERFSVRRLDRALRRWAARLGEVPPERMLEVWRRNGIRLIIPGDAEWPGQLDVLGDARPWGLWVRGDTDLRYACLRSVSVVGTRAATAYGAHVCTELATALAESGWTVVSGGA